MFGFLTSPDEKTRARYGPALAGVREWLRRLEPEAPERLRERATALRQAARERGRTPEFSAEAIALIAEAADRTHGLKAYDCQLIAGLALVDGALAEMATGEGKTLVTMLPAFALALDGRGTHVATVNPYLAGRDAEFARPVFAMLGLTVGLLVERDAPPVKRAAYECDVTYGVGSEFGFDYLRDQIALRAAIAARGRAPLFHERFLNGDDGLPDGVQRGLACAVIDEADSVLVDEARSPLIVSVTPNSPCEQPEVYVAAKAAAAELKREVDFKIRPGGRPELTPEGEQRALDLLPDEVIPLLRRLWNGYIQNALQARFLIRRDIHYVVLDDKAVIVDEFTGRLCPERTWRGGLHQAVEAQAGVTIQEENNSEATITRPAYFQLYDRICGLTGTAQEVAREMEENYKISTAVIPLNRPSRRELLPDRVFTSREKKLAAVAADVAARRARGQPVLIGTRTIENSEALAEHLLKQNFPFRLLNAKQDKEEAEIVEKAGEPGTVTIATNMAGRGAHIPVPSESLAAGGLHVIGLERHESARIDRQLIGRGARQGQPGGAQMFLSLEDDLILRHAPKLAEKLRRQARADGELPASAASHFARIQRKVEAADAAARRALAQHDEWINELKHAL